MRMNCHYCDKALSIKTKTKDHKTARSLGGNDFPDNIVLSCNHCNNKKSLLEMHLSELKKALLYRKYKNKSLEQFYLKYKKNGLNFYISVWIELFRKYRSVLSFDNISYLLHPQEKYDFTTKLSSNNVLLQENCIRDF